MRSRVLVAIGSYGSNSYSYDTVGGATYLTSSASRGVSFKPGLTTDNASDPCHPRQYALALARECYSNRMTTVTARFYATSAWTSSAGPQRSVLPTATHAAARSRPRTISTHVSPLVLSSRHVCASSRASHSWRKTVATSARCVASCTSSTWLACGMATRRHGMRPPMARNIGTSLAASPKAATWTDGSMWSACRLLSTCTPRAARHTEIRISAHGDQDLGTRRWGGAATRAERGQAEGGGGEGPHLWMAHEPREGAALVDASHADVHLGPRILHDSELDAPPHAAARRTARHAAVHHPVRAHRPLDVELPRAALGLVARHVRRRERREQEDDLRPGDRRTGRERREGRVWERATAP